MTLPAGQKWTGGSIPFCVWFLFLFRILKSVQVGGFTSFGIYKCTFVLTVRQILKSKSDFNLRVIFWFFFPKNCFFFQLHTDLIRV